MRNVHECLLLDLFKDKPVEAEEAELVACEGLYSMQLDGVPACNHLDRAVFAPFSLDFGIVEAACRFQLCVVEPYIDITIVPRERVEQLEDVFTFIRLNLPLLSKMVMKSLNWSGFARRKSATV